MFGKLSPVASRALTGISRTRLRRTCGERLPPCSSSSGATIRAAFSATSRCRLSLSIGCRATPAARKHIPRYPLVSAKLVIGRLAVDSRCRSKGYGSLLLGWSLRKAHENAAVVGSCMVVVEALDEPAARFYEAHGFIRLEDPAAPDHADADDRGPLRAVAGHPTPPRWRIRPAAGRSARGRYRRAG